jgi:hypothetical protein
MIKKVTNINLVPQDLQELLVPDTGEYVAIGRSMYEMFPFSITQYLDLLSFIGKYFNTYNTIFETVNKNIASLEFFGLLAGRMKEDNTLEELFKIFPDMQDDLKEITKDQLIYFLAMIYKLNFLVKKNPINLQNRTAMNKMLEMMGLTALQNQS